jgi:hypothetical protein
MVFQLLWKLAKVLTVLEIRYLLLSNTVSNMALAVLVLRVMHISILLITGLHSFAIGISPVELYSVGTSKNARIAEMLKAYIKGELQVHPKVRPLVHAQIVAFNPLTRKNTDGILDCLCFMTKMVSTYPHLIAGTTIQSNQEAGDIRIYDELENAAF